MIRVLIVDDSAVLRHSIRLILQSDPELEIVGEASNGVDALAMASSLKPAVITMDIRMPKMDGLGAIRQIMSDSPIPIVVVTSIDLTREMEIAEQATKLGALSILARPTSTAPAEFGAFAAKLIEQVKLMSAVKVIRRARGRLDETPPPAPIANLGLVTPHEIEIAAIGSSTGGPAALYQILGALPADFPVPIMIVQHISFGFVEGLAGWLEAVCPLHVQVGKLGDRVEPGKVYIAPDGCHMVVDRSHRINLKESEAVGGFRPAINVLFESVAQAYGASGMGVILTGMGSDGAIGMQQMHVTGALTIAQDEANCVVFGMPKEAIARGAAREITPLDQIASRMVAWCAASKRMALA